MTERKRAPKPTSLLGVRPTGLGAEIPAAKAKLKKYALKRDLSIEGPNWIAIAIETAAFEHPELRDPGASVGRPATAEKLSEYRSLVTAAEQIKERFKSSMGKTPSDLSVATELAMQKYQEEYGRLPDEGNIGYLKDSMRNKIKRAKKVLAQEGLDISAGN